MKIERLLIVALSAVAISSGPALFALPSPQEHHDAEAKQQRGDITSARKMLLSCVSIHKKIEHVDTAHRTALVAGGHLPGDWHGRMRPVPVDVIRELPPAPPGYVFGYIDGYCVVYNPTTLLIADVIDLATLSR